MALNLGSPEHKADPFPFYARLRAESPVCTFSLPDGQTAWLITRYDDVALALTDERFAKHRSHLLRPLSRTMLDLDGPDHTRLRALVSKAFTPRLVERMRPRVQALADGLLDAALRRGGMDLIRDYALPLPTTMIAEMLGVPAGDRHKFQRWTQAIVSTNRSLWQKGKVLWSFWAFRRYIGALIKARRAAPRDDLLSALVQAEQAGDRLSADELEAMICLLLVAGHETTVNLVGNGVLALLQHPDQLCRLRDDPALVRPAVEELLRYNCPVEVASERYTTEDVVVAGVTIPRESLVFAAVVSANRDGRQFKDADVLDLTREPNKHLTFGLGAHYCLGASLARLEGQVALATLLRRAPGLRLAVPPAALRWREVLLLRGVESLPVVFGT